MHQGGGNHGVEDLPPAVECGAALSETAAEFPASDVGSLEDVVSWTHADRVESASREIAAKVCPFLRSMTPEARQAMFDLIALGREQVETVNITERGSKKSIPKVQEPAHTQPEKRPPAKAEDTKSKVEGVTVDQAPIPEPKPVHATGLHDREQSDVARKPAPDEIKNRRTANNPESVRPANQQSTTAKQAEQPIRAEDPVLTPLPEPAHTAGPEPLSGWEDLRRALDANVAQASRLAAERVGQWNDADRLSADDLRTRSSAESSQASYEPLNISDDSLEVHASAAINERATSVANTIIDEVEVMADVAVDMAVALSGALVTEAVQLHRPETIITNEARETHALLMVIAAHASNVIDGHPSTVESVTAGAPDTHEETPEDRVLKWLAAERPAAETMQTLGSIREAAASQPPEKVLVQFATHLENAQLGNEDIELSEDDQTIRQLVATLEKTITASSAAEKHMSIWLTPEVTQQLLDLLGAVGYSDPQEALLDLVSRHNPEFIRQLIHYLYQLTYVGDRQEFSAFQYVSDVSGAIQATASLFGRAVVAWVVKAGASVVELAA